MRHLLMSAFNSKLFSWFIQVAVLQRKVKKLFPMSTLYRAPASVGFLFCGVSILNDS